MPARIVLVHDDTDLRERATAAIGEAGYEVAAFEGSMAALDALREAQTLELLITRMNFSLLSPHGISLANLARRKFPTIKVLFIARPEHQEHAEGIGEFMPAPVSIPELVRRVSALLKLPSGMTNEPPA